MYQVNFNVTNAKNTPSIAADTFANRPAVAATGAVYIATDTGSMYRYNGSAWTSIGGGGVSGSGTATYIPYWTSASALGSTTLTFTTGGGYPTTTISGTTTTSFDLSQGDPSTSGQASGFVVRRQATNKVMAFVLGKDTLLNSGTPVFNIYAQDDLFLKIFGATDYYHSFYKNGNVVLNGYTDAGYKLDVTGSIRATGPATIADSAFAFTPVTIKGGSTDGSVYIGGSSMAGNNAVRNVVINPINSYSALTGSGNTILGRSASNALTSGSSNIYIGSGGNGISTGSNNIFISGNLSHAFQAAQSGCLVINTVGNGGTAGVDFDYPTTNNWTSIGGYNSGTVNNQFYFGGSPFLNQSFGAATSAITFFAPSGIGTNIFGGDFSLAAGRGTGNATPGDLIFQTSTATTSGATLQTLTSRWFVKGGSGTLSNQASVLSTALIDMYSTTQGLKVPVMTTAQKNAISNTAGLIVFDSTLAKLCINSGAGWQTITSV
jgi:hypothetical protein